MTSLRAVTMRKLPSSVMVRKPPSARMIGRISTLGGSKARAARVGVAPVDGQALVDSAGNEAAYRLRAKVPSTSTGPVGMPVTDS